MALVDQFGAPLSKKKTRRPKGTDLFLQLPQVEALTKWDVGHAHRSALAHEMGQFDCSARMYFAMLTDPRISDGLEKRALARRGMRYEIVEGEGKGKRLLADKMRRRWGIRDNGKPGPNLVRAPRVAAEIHGQELLLGMGVAQPEWEHSDDELFYPKVQPWHPQLLYYLPVAMQEQADGQYPGRLYTYCWGSEKGSLGVQIPITPNDGQWMVWRLIGDQKPWLFGKLRSCWRPWISRLMAMLLWLRYNDVHGMPIRVVKTPMGMRKTPEMQRFYGGVKNIGRDATLLAPHSQDGKFFVGIDLVEAKAESWRSFEALLKHTGSEITIDLTGGTQNTEATGGNYKGAQEQMEIRHEVKAADAEADQEVINEQLFVPFAVLNGYEPEAAPRLVYDTDPPRNRKADADAAAAEFLAMQEAAEAAEMLEKRGVKVSVVDILKDRGINLPSGTTQGPVPKPPAPLPAPTPPPGVAPGGQEEAPE